MQASQFVHWRIMAYRQCLQVLGPAALRRLRKMDAKYSENYVSRSITNAFFIVSIKLSMLCPLRYQFHITTCRLLYASYTTIIILHWVNDC